MQRERFFHHNGDIVSVPSRSPGRLGRRIKASSRADQRLQGNEPDQGQPERMGDENTSKLWLLQMSSPLKNSSSITGSAHKQKSWYFVPVGRIPTESRCLLEMGHVKDAEPYSLTVLRQELSVSTRRLHKQSPQSQTQNKYFLF